MKVDEQRLFVRSALMLDAAELVVSAMDERGWSRNQLAEQMRISPTEILRLLRGKEDFTLTGICDIMHTLGFQVHLTKVEDHPVSQVIKPLGADNPRLLTGRHRRPDLKARLGLWIRATFSAWWYQRYTKEIEE